MAKSIHRVSVTLQNIAPLGSDIKQLSLSDPDGWDLPRLSLVRISMCICLVERPANIHYAVTP